MRPFVGPPAPRGIPDARPSLVDRGRSATATVTIGR
jgi:hypothetical protein